MSVSYTSPMYCLNGCVPLFWYTLPYGVYVVWDVRVLPVLSTIFCIDPRLSVSMLFTVGVDTPTVSIVAYFLVLF